MSQKNNWEIVAFASEGKSSTPQTIKRLSDETLFSLGDYVTNGTKMKGHIERFDYDFKDGGLFVYTDWSGIGMNLESIMHATKLPSAHQIGHAVQVNFAECGIIKNCEVIKVHFTESKVLYDVEITGRYEKSRDLPAGTWSTRLYNVDSCFVEKPSK